MRIYLQNVCLLCRTIYFITMKNLSGSFKSEESRVTGLEFLSESEMLFIRGGTEPIKPKSRPRDVYDDEEGAATQQSPAKSSGQSLLDYLKSLLDNWKCK